ncbi:membrane protein insertion efficiency factor YidD [Helicobacter sp. 13S00482-2]|uniref:membrane protein insertion efficiency factor YidD n=1 Tax=Helicobacter sp. 13S00482-2 TaxID=1476200 RepID=UPI000BA50A9A|nr:membrane protein insertion efficiency factor YidD [Helicobacter sp. 13S00482-2]PAF53327.1 membrane protein insertion efficiency factor YidD [Helicobacter sp. 13S00482-2]
MFSFLKVFISFYQKYISPLLPKSCRYYPTCSQYALWSIQFNHPLFAFYKILLRILRCNQLFLGGIDYPIGNWFLKGDFLSPQKIDFWLVPIEKHTQNGHAKKIKFYIIKSL